MVKTIGGQVNGKPEGSISEAIPLLEEYGKSTASSWVHVLQMPNRLNADAIKIDTRADKANVLVGTKQ